MRDTGGAGAATRSWTGGGADGNWSSAANWGGTAPVENDALAFGGSVRLANINDLATDTRLNGITFLAGAGAFSLTGNRIALGGDITNDSTENQFSGLSFALQQDTAFVIAEASGLLTVTGAVSGAYGVTKKGQGQLKLYPKAVCTYTGDTAVYGGQLLLGWIYRSGTANPLSTSSHLVLSSGILTFIANASTESQAFNGTELKTGANIIHINKNNAGALTASLGALTRESGATLNIARTGISSGTKNLSSSSWTSGQTILDSGVAYATTYFSSTSTGIPTLTGNDWAAFTGTTVGAATYTASTSTNLTGNANIATGTDTTLSNDTDVTTLRFAPAEARTITVMPGKTLTTGGILVSSAVGDNLSSITNGTLCSAATVADRDLVIINNDTSSSLAIGSVIADAAAGATGLTKSGPGTLTLTAANTYTGPTVINAGEIIVSSVAIKNTAQPLGMGDLVLGGGTLIYAVGGTLFSTDKNIMLLEGTTSTVEVNATAAGEKGVSGGAGRITGAGNLVINAATGSATDSRLTMNGSNDFTGTLTINSGYLQVSNNSIGSNANIVVNSGGCLRMFTSSANITRRWGLGGLSGAGKVFGGYESYTTNVFAVGGLNTDSTFSGVIANHTYRTTARAALAKVGTGTLTLSGANTYSGQTTVEAGTLKLGANGTLPSGSAVSVFADAVLDVGATTNAPPSLGGAGTLKMSGNGWLNVSGELNVADLTLELTDQDLLAKETRVIATGSPVTGPFKATNVTAPWTVRYTGTEVRLVYNGGTLIKID